MNDGWEVAAPDVVGFVSSTLCGIGPRFSAWTEADIHSVLAAFPEYADLRSPEKNKITLRHLLTMSQGLAWDEDLPYSDPRNSEVQMNEASIRWEFPISNGSGSRPGSRWLPPAFACVRVT